MTSVAHGLAVAVRLLRLDASLVDTLSGSAAEARQSVRVVLMAAPLYLVVLAVAGEVPPAELARFWVLVLEASHFAIQWLALPAAVSWIAPRLGLGSRVFRFVTVYNYGLVVLLLVYLAVAVLVTILPGGLAAFALLALVVLPFYSVVYSAVAFRAALDCPMGLAAGLAAADLAVAILVTVWTSTLLYGMIGS